MLILNKTDHMKNDDSIPHFKVKYSIFKNNPINYHGME